MLQKVTLIESVMSETLQKGSHTVLRYSTSETLLERILYRKWNVKNQLQEYK